MRKVTLSVKVPRGEEPFELCGWVSVGERGGFIVGMFIDVDFTDRKGRNKFEN